MSDSESSSSSNSDSPPPDEESFKNIPLGRLARLQGQSDRNAKRKALQIQDGEKPVTASKGGSKKPLELSSKRPQRAPAAFASKKRFVRDPRFSETSGQLNVAKFGQSYSFLNNHRASEVSLLEEELKKGDLDEDQQMELAGSLKAMRSQELQRKRTSELVEAQRQQRKSERRKILETGKLPFYQSHSQLKTNVKAAKSEDASTHDKSKALIRKAKRASTKDRKLIPQRRT